MTIERSLDCRGLSEAVAVLRIKQALDCAPDEQPKLQAHLGTQCCEDTVLSALQSDAGNVSVKVAG